MPPPPPQELDPGGKFASLAADIWRWNYTLAAGGPASAAQCCDADAGFDAVTCACGPVGGGRR